MLTTDLQSRHIFTYAKCKNCGGESYKVLCKGMAFFSPIFHHTATNLVSIILTVKNLHVLVLYDTVFLSICCITCMFTHKCAPEFSVKICNS